MSASNNALASTVESEDEAEIDMNQFNMDTFLDSSHEESTDDESVSAKRPRSNITNHQISEISQMQLKNRMTYKNIGSVIDLVNNVPGSVIDIPSNKQIYQKIVNEMCPTEAVILIFCSKCDELVEQSEVCECGTHTEKDSKKNNYLVHFPLMPQIRRLLTEYFDEIMHYLKRDHPADIISDVDDGELFKKIQRKIPSIVLERNS